MTGSVSTHSGNPVEELTRLSKQIKDKPLTNMMLRCDEQGRLSFQEKSFIITLKRMFGSQEYNFEENIEKIGGLFLQAKDQKIAKDELSSLKSSLGELIRQVETKKNRVPFWKFWDRPKTEKIKLDIQRLQATIGYVSQPVNPRTIQVTKGALAVDRIQKLQKEYEKKSYAQKHAEVSALATELQHTIGSSRRARDAYAWLADQAAQFFEFDLAVSLYENCVLASIDAEDANPDKLDEFVEIALISKKYDSIEMICQKLEATNRQKAQAIRARVERIEFFGVGERSFYRVSGKDAEQAVSGFTKQEAEMLESVSGLFSGKGIGNDQERARDFLIYATGNMDLNQRAKAHVDLYNKGKVAIDNDDILSVVLFLSLYSFKSNPSAWKSNQVQMVHMQKVGELFEAKQKLTAVIKQLEHPVSIGEEAFQATDQKGYAVTEKKVQRGQTKGFTRRKQKTVYETRYFPPLSADTWKKTQAAEFARAQEQARGRLQQEKKELEETCRALQVELREMKKQFPTINGNPEKLQPAQLKCSDSLEHFTAEMNPLLRSKLNLDVNPFYRAMYDTIGRAKKQSEWLHEECERTSSYHSGDVSFVNVFKEERVLGKKKSGVFDQLPAAFSPFGHMSLIDESYGYIGFSHQQNAFNHDSVGLLEFLYNDAYRLDLAKFIRPEGLDAFAKILEEEGRDLEGLSSIFGSRQAYLVEALEEEYEEAFIDALAQSQMPDQKKLDAVEERPNFATVSTLKDLTTVLSQINAKYAPEMHLTPFDVLHVTEDHSDIERQNIENIRIECLKELYKDIRNDMPTQIQAFMNSWLFAGDLKKGVAIVDKDIDPRQIQMLGEMCCSQFAFLITMKALYQLEQNLQNRYGKEVQFFNIPKVTGFSYKGTTPEFFIKNFNEFLKPVPPPTILKEIVEVNAGLFEAFPIEPTIEYMVKALRGEYRKFST